MELELRHLKVVCALADEGSVTKAAASLGLAQPALSAQLGRIEKSLGGPLFERDHRGVRSTALGDLVLARARVMLPAMSGLKEEAARLASHEGRDPGTPTHLTLGASTSVVLGRLIRSLALEHPDVHVSTRASWSSDELAEGVVDGRVDVAVVGVCADAPPPTRHGLTWRTVTTDPVFVLLPEHHRLAGRDEVALADLADEDWAAIPVDGCFTGCFAAACARAGFTPRTLYEADAASCIDLVASGLAVALCQPTREVPGLVTVPVADAPLRWNHLVGWHADAAVAPFADEIVRLTSDAFAEMIAESPVYSSWLRGRSGFGVLPAAAITPTV
ncbi:LysR family transcriptional regulator [Aeromicrobium sp. CFBP 8757]|uniref:LysR family transcriptional regulator n=1 Tax=Aeromicrobium sp. CFBP 8757 TaxID=2775288 RepID=UPI00177B9AF5|nr:LysR family transcriptional regulator [Aeromicrobium sp. CFBP 8757]MBD8608617.1 LysR family transcriptional regulator [Aeromicrobium sp. CFBP 8757]